MMKAHITSVPFCPNELNKIYRVLLSATNSEGVSCYHHSTVAIGCPIGLLTIFCKSVPMQKAKATMMPFRSLCTHLLTAKSNQIRTPSEDYARQRGKQDPIWYRNIGIPSLFTNMKN